MIRLSVERGQPYRGEAWARLTAAHLRLEATSGRTAREFIPDGTIADVRGVVLSPDGRTLAALEYEQISLWNVQQRRRVLSLKNHGKNILITCAVFTSDGKGLLVAYGPKSRLGPVGPSPMKLWDLDSGQLAREFDGHSMAIDSLIISGDGKTAFSGSEDRTIRLWDIKSGRLLEALKGHEAQVTALAISPDGKALASGSPDTTVRLWNLGAGK